MGNNPDRLFGNKMEKSKKSVDYSYHRSANYLKKLVSELPQSREKSIAMQCVDVMEENERLRYIIAQASYAMCDKIVGMPFKDCQIAWDILNDISSKDSVNATQNTEKK